MSRYLLDQIEAHPAIDIHHGVQLRELHGDASMHAVTIDGAAGRIAANALFVFIGADPCTGWLSGALATDEDGILLTGQDLRLTHLDPTRAGRDRPPLPLETSRPGVFAADDVRSGSIKRVVFGSSCAFNRCCEATSRHPGRREARNPWKTSGSGATRARGEVTN